MSNPKKSILIVDDQSPNIFALSAVLIPRGYNCTAALTGEQCMGILESRPPLDIILMDYNMPKMNGLEAIRFIRQIPEYRKTKIVVITADDSPGLRMQSVSAGADGFMTKPVDADRLEELLNA